MATIPDRSSLLDDEKLLEECDNEQSFANKCLHVFVRVAQADMSDISAALDRNDFSQIARLAHRIKGASASIRAEFLREQAARLEVLGSQEKSVAVSECYARLKAEFEHFEKFVATLPNIPD